MEAEKLRALRYCRCSESPLSLRDSMCTNAQGIVSKCSVMCHFLNLNPIEFELSVVIQPRLLTLLLLKILLLLCIMHFSFGLDYD